MAEKSAAATKLLRAARAAARRAYAPYSKFRVGAAVRAGSRVFTGANVENASYGLSICAERVALFAAAAAGYRRVDAVAVSCIDARKDANDAALMPCGACRQVMAEFGAAAMPVHVDGVGQFSLAELLPEPFALRPRRPRQSRNSGARPKATRP
jgi:cytidine deaminase